MEITALAGHETHRPFVARYWITNPTDQLPFAGAKNKWEEVQVVQSDLDIISSRLENDCPLPGSEVIS
jgi:hypothetical protein